MRALKRGFTLIEVMVVLSILAIIAVLAYSYFGSTLKQSRLSSGATQIIKDLNLLSEAAERYLMAGDEGELPAGWDATAIGNADAQGSGMRWLFDPLVSEFSLIKALPLPPEATKEPTYATLCSSAVYQDNYFLSEWEDYDNSGQTDVAMLVDGLTQEACAELNRVATGDPTIWDWSDNGNTYPTPAPPVACYGYTCGAGKAYYVMMPVRNENQL